MSGFLGIRNHCSPGKGSSSPPRANPLLRRSPGTACPVLGCRDWQEPLSLRELLAPPSQGGCPGITPTRALLPQSCPAPGFFCGSCPTSRPSHRVEAFPRGPEAPGCSSLRPWGQPSPAPTSLLATAGRPSPPLCIFSLGGGLGAGSPAHILSPPSLGGPGSLGLKPGRRLWSGEAPSSLPRAAGKEGCAVGGAWGGSSKPILSPFNSPARDQYSPNQYSPEEFSF